MAVADRNLTARVVRTLVGWDGPVMLARVVRLAYPIAPGMQIDLSGYGVPDRACIRDVREINAPNPDNPDQIIDHEITLECERGDGNRLPVALAGDWKRQTKEEPTR